MPVFKVWDVARERRAMVLAGSIEEVLRKGGEKLNVHPVKIVLESDGTEVDENDILTTVEVQSQTLLLLAENESWCSQHSKSTADTSTTSVDIGESSQDSELLGKTMHDVQTPRKEVTLPKFSTYVMDELSRGHAKAVWTKMIDECAYFYTTHLGVQTSEDYKSIGKEMYQQYPDIAHEGNEPWSYFNRCLSQRIRHLRWNMKRKSRETLTAPKKVSKSRNGMTFPQRSSGTVEVDPAEDVSHVDMIKKEMEKGTPNKQHLFLLLKESYSNRRRWMSSVKSGDIKTIISEYPCLEMGEFVMQEFLLITKQTAEGIRDRADTVMKTVSKMTKCREDALQMLDVIHYVENQTRYDRGKGNKTQSFMTICEDAADFETPTKSKGLDPPRLIVFTQDGEIQQCTVVGDEVKVSYNPTTSADALILLMASYYAFDLEYPKIYSQALGFFQQFMIGDKFCGKMSSRYSQFTTKYVSVSKEV